jgi:hypothetical protein
VAFDFSELSSAPNLNLNAVSHVRIIDAVGSINPLWGTRDASGRLINDPYPTAFASGGFDLDAVAGLYPQTTGLQKKFTEVSITAAPQPAADHALLTGLTPGQRYSIVDALGRVCHRFEATSTQHRLDRGDLGHISSVCWLFSDTDQNKQRAVKLFWR